MDRWRFTPGIRFGVGQMWGDTRNAETMKRDPRDERTGQAQERSMASGPGQKEFKLPHDTRQALNESMLPSLWN
jgi:hypothetical protein